MKALTLSLKKKWFDMIKSGTKKEEYRECSEYWISHFVKDFKVHSAFRFEVCFRNWEYATPSLIESVQRCLDSLNFDKLVFTLGYPKADDTSRRIEFKNPKIRIGEGRPEWGAEKGKKYFVITWEGK